MSHLALNPVLAFRYPVHVQRVNRDQYRDTMPSAGDVEQFIQAKLVPSDLAVMPREWLEQLAQAAHRVNAKLILKLILKLIDQIPAKYDRLIQGLTLLVNNFHFAEIVTLTQL